MHNKKFNDRRDPFFNTISEDTLPDRYGITRLVILPRDPYCIYAYWEVTPSDIKRVIKNIPQTQREDLKYILRFYDVTLINFDGTNANNTFDIEIDINANNWYINVWSDNISYCAQLGIRTKKGDFYSITQSNFITLPRAFPSNREDLVWMKVTPKKEEIIKEYPKVEDRKEKVEYSKNILSSRIAREPTNLYKEKNFSTRIYEKKIRRIPISPEEIRLYYSRIFPLLSKTLRGKYTYKSGKDYKKDKFFLDDILRKEASLENFVRMLLHSGGSEQLVSSFHKQEKNILSENIGSIFIQGEKEKDFFFYINTELIVYGRTEPTAKVYLNKDTEVKLREDGTFTLRFSLPPGEIPLQFKAVSQEGTHSKNIGTNVTRKDI